MIPGIVRFFPPPSMDGREGFQGGGLKTEIANRQNYVLATPMQDQLPAENGPLRRAKDRFLDNSGPRLVFARRMRPMLLDTLSEGRVGGEGNWSVQTGIGCGRGCC